MSTLSRQRKDNEESLDVILWEDLSLYNVGARGVRVHPKLMSQRGLHEGQLVMIKHCGADSSRSAACHPPQAVGFLCKDDRLPPSSAAVSLAMYLSITEEEQDEGGRQECGKAASLTMRRTSGLLVPLASHHWRSAAAITVCPAAPPSIVSRLAAGGLPSELPLVSSLGDPASVSYLKASIQGGYYSLSNWIVVSLRGSLAAFRIVDVALQPGEPPPDPSPAGRIERHSRGSEAGHQDHVSGRQSGEGGDEPELAFHSSYDKHDGLDAGAATSGQLLCGRVEVTTSVAVHAPPLQLAGHAEGAKDSHGVDDTKRDSSGFRRFGGFQSVVEQLQSILQWPLLHPSLYKEYGVRPPKGVLLYGPPGTGKTLLARCLVEELEQHQRHVAEGVGIGLEVVAATDLLGHFVGESERKIINLFERGQERWERYGTPTLIFIDEIDAICPQRDQAGEAERRIVGTFLTCLDGSRACPGVFVLAATNRPNSLDTALRRCGRLEREVEVGVPTATDRQQIIRIAIQHLPHTLTDIDIEELSKRCQAFVGADLVALVNTAASVALTRVSSRSPAGPPAESVLNLSCFEEALKLVRPSGMKELHIEVPEVRWSDIGGYHDLKSQLQECVDWPIRYEQLFRDLQLSPPRGVLLYGPPGNSKTMMAKAVATETQMNFISIKGPELFSKWVGEAERAVRELFRKARQNSPCVVFFDEIDALGVDRELGGDAGGVGSRVLSQLLNEIDGIAPVKQVVVIAATNRPDLLDAALLRPGRFDRLLYVSLPDAAARYEIFKANLSRLPLDLGTQDSQGGQDSMSLETFLGQLVNNSKGYSGAEICMVCREAAMAAIRAAIRAGQDDRGGSHATGRDNGGPSCVLVSASHLREALRRMQPRTNAESVSFFESYRRKAGREVSSKREID